LTAWLSGSIVSHINEVAEGPARLVPGLVTISPLQIHAYFATYTLHLLMVSTNQRLNYKQQTKRPTLAGMKVGSKTMKKTFICKAQTVG